MKEVDKLIPEILNEFEEMQLMIEMEYGGSTSIKQCIDKGEMPDVYYRLKEIYKSNS